MKDEAINEIREVRHRLSARSDHDIEKYCEYLRGIGAHYGEQIRRFEKLDEQRRAAGGILRVAGES